MAFDLSTARPIGAGGFDLSTAVPVQQPSLHNVPTAELLQMLQQHMNTTYHGMTPVTDPAILSQLEGTTPSGLTPVSDPVVLAQLNGKIPSPIVAQSADGVLHQFPAGTEQATIDKAMREYAALKSQPSAIESGIRGAANGATFNLMPMIAAAGDATIPLDAGSSTASSWLKRYQENLTNQTSRDQAMAAAHPDATMAGNIAGAVFNPAIRALPLARTVGGAVGQGLGIGASYGAGTALSDQDTLPQAARDIGEGAALGAVIPAAIPALAGVGRQAGRMATAVLGNLTTGAGANAVRGAFDAGVQGGDQGAAFLANLRGDANWRDVVDQARDALGQMRADRNAAYRSGMVDISNDKSVLDFAPVQKAMDDAANIQSYKGQTIGGTADQTRDALQGAIDKWAKLDPGQYHTPEGLDFLKQQVGEILADTKPNSASSTMAGKVYSAIKGAITDQAPTYAKVMSDYSNASDAVNDIQRELSLGPKGNPATALRKLQSVMRDNANTSWGQRADYAKTLADNGAGTLMPALAGQALSPLMPRGLSKIGAGADLALAAFHNPGALAALPLTSPRLVGETAYGLGRGFGMLPKISGLTRANVASAITAPGVAALVPAMLPRLP